jgi:hypothetical protein
MSLPADYSRCRGVDTEAKCQHCARRHQIARDDPERYYPYFAGAPVNGRCEYFIQEMIDEPKNRP